MKNGIFTTSWAVVGSSVLTAVAAAVLTAAVLLVTTTGFDVFTANWAAIVHSMVNIGVIAGVVTLGNDILSTNQGSLLGVGPATTPELG